VISEKIGNKSGEARIYQAAGDGGIASLTQYGSGCDK
jgi:hypothetical protein